MDFALTRLRAKGRGFQSALEAISADKNAVLRPARRWGIFFGLFGLASNELFIISVGDVEGVNERLLALEAVVEAETLLLQPTVRPTTEEPLRRHGLYVFRYFEVANEDIEAIAALSKEAWETFETTSDYEAEPQALFCQTDRSTERGQMLLLTWYDGFSSWQTSRKPNPKASENFARRHGMTEGTIAYATRLVTQPVG